MDVDELPLELEAEAKRLADLELRLLLLRASRCIRELEQARIARESYDKKSLPPAAQSRNG